MNAASVNDPFSADDLCLPIQDHLERYLRGFLPRDLDPPYLWRQLPEEDAMDTVSYPAVAVSTNGTTGSWRYGRSAVSATWRVVIAFWVEDFGYDETTSAVRRYVAAGRNCILAAGRSDWRVTGEDYSRITDPAMAKILGGGRVYLEIAADVVDLTALRLESGDALPVVTSHTTTVSPKE